MSRPTRHRQRRERRTAASPLAHIPWLTIKNPMPPLTRLDAEAEEKIHNASMQILEEIGIAFMVMKHWPCGRLPERKWITAANMYGWIAIWCLIWSPKRQPSSPGGPAIRNET
jgi:hypothetical protein